MNEEQLNMLARRVFLKGSVSLGALALAELTGGVRLLGQETGGVKLKSYGVLKNPDFTPRAKRVILIHQIGAVSQVDTFEYKPMLDKMNGEELPPSVRGNGRLSTMSAAQVSFPLVKPMRPFAQHGQSGAWVSELFPYTAKIVDDLCFIKTVRTDHVNHDPAAKFMHTGFQLAGRPPEGAWVNYAIGSENQNLPAFVALTSGTFSGVSHDASNWGSGFLPSQYQGVPFRSGKDPVLYVSNPDGVDMTDRRRMLDVIAKIADAQHTVSNDPEIPAKISQYEMAYRMMTSVPEVADISNEPESVLEMYGPNVKKPGSFARNCLLARRLAERDVRFISVMHVGWDHHTNILQRHPPDCLDVDQPSAALVTDLKQRGMLKDTLVMWGSEFGRTSFAQGKVDINVGRDHHGNNFVWWLAGGGVKPGFSHGETDDFSYNTVKDPVEIHDVHATMLYILGIDHEKLTWRSQGRDFRLTDVSGQVVKQILT
ncbi:MAG TPA: DUF1501 domain-containing protein [Bryobacteraceae bacterium]|nr:DUF1501 domain-containing protein [Bryobacteraceae bacterium]